METEEAKLVVVMPGEKSFQRAHKTLRDNIRKISLLGSLFIDAARSYREIREGMLYLTVVDSEGKPKYRTFTEYLAHLKSETSGLDRSTVYRLLKELDTYQSLRPVVSVAAIDPPKTIEPPKTRKQLEALGKIKDVKKRNESWERASIERNGNPSYNAIIEAAEQLGVEGLSRQTSSASEQVAQIRRILPRLREFAEKDDTGTLSEAIVEIERIVGKCDSPKALVAPTAATAPEDGNQAPGGESNALSVSVRAAYSIWAQRLEVRVKFATKADYLRLKSKVPEWDAKFHFEGPPIQEWFCRCDSPEAAEKMKESTDAYLREGEPDA